MDNSSRLMIAVIMVMACMAMGAEAQNTTMAPNATMTPVPAFTQSISRTNCGKTQFCAAEPSDCDPAMAGSCFFVSMQQSSGQTFSLQLRGESRGYIAVGFSKNTTQGVNDTTYVCANNNGTMKFFTTLLLNKVLTVTGTLPVDSVNGSVNGQIIQCTFSATLPEATTSFVLSISNGTVINETLGTPKVVLVSNAAVNLANPNSTVINFLNAIPTTATSSTTATPTTTANSSTTTTSNTTANSSTTTTSNTTANSSTNATSTITAISITPSSHALGLQHTLSQALLILLGVLGMMML
ncbi:uncharacterized protein LOC129864821 [Salvelinus fontinalis]|uniref:uncharacterized protein LOC129864821 n=1 Tax=Salvelinus fontinalis TaxID=8038 RepID=UPI0024865C84|nr:uncharacterized protein LOC129864821 [Salvelinus fontinalis]